MNSHLLKVISSIIAVIGTLDNLFVIIVFALFIKITDKVGLYWRFYLLHNPRVVMSDFRFNLCCGRQRKDVHCLGWRLS